MSRKVQLVLLCEDHQHATFARRFLEKAGWSARRLRIELGPPGRGSAEQFVRERFPKELRAYRANRHRVAEALIVMVDGDNKGVGARIAELDGACQAAGLETRKPDERVAIFVPTWCIETWLAYLNGSNVDESKEDYPRLGRPGECREHVNQLHEMCRGSGLRQPSPPSLDAACEEYRSRLHAT
ncbi:MAG: hypothetical protein U1F76_05450 [Candidatus Competibacteraceae bacterium]